MFMAHLLQRNICPRKGGTGVKIKKFEAEPVAQTMKFTNNNNLV